MAKSLKSQRPRDEKGRYLPAPMFDQALWAAILERFASGEHIGAICAEPIEYGDGQEVTIHRSTVYLWQKQNPAIRDEYLEAEALHYNAQASEIIEIADGAHNEGDDDDTKIKREMLKCKYRAWPIERRLERFSAKQQVQHTTPPLVLNLGPIPEDDQGRFGSDDVDAGEEDTGA